MSSVSASTALTAPKCADGLEAHQRRLRVRSLTASPPPAIDSPLRGAALRTRLHAQPGDGCQRSRQTQSTFVIASSKCAELLVSTRHICVPAHLPACAARSGDRAAIAPRSHRDLRRSRRTSGEIGSTQRRCFHHHRPVGRARQYVGEKLHGDIAGGHAAINTNTVAELFDAGQSACMASSRSRVW